MRTDLLQRDLAGIFRDAAALPSGANTVRIGGTDIPCEPAQPYAGLSPDIDGEWGEASARVIVETSRFPRWVKVGDTCDYNGAKRRITGMETNVDGLTVELALGGVRA